MRAVGDHHGEVAVPVVDAQQEAGGAGEPDDLAAAHLGDLHEPVGQEITHDFDTVAAARPDPRASPACVLSPCSVGQLQHPQPIGAA